MAFLNPLSSSQPTTPFCAIGAKNPSNSSSTDELVKITMPQAIASFAAQNQSSTSAVAVATEQADLFASAAVATGIDLKAPVVIQGSNSVEWMTAFIGAANAGCVPVGVYPTNQPEATQHVAKDCQAQLAIVENMDQLRKYQSMDDSAIRCFVVWNDFDPQKAAELNLSAEVCSWSSFMERGSEDHVAELEERVVQVQPDDLATIVYTSGTTGLPKGAKLSHDNLLWTARMMSRAFKITEKDSVLSYLPLSHVAALQTDIVGPLVNGYNIDMAPADALKGAKLGSVLREKRPTVFLGVPRVWEKFRAVLEGTVKKQSLMKRTLFKGATGVTRTYVQLKRTVHNAQSSFLKRLAARIAKVALAPFYFLAKVLVIDKIKKRVGLDRCRIAASGAAPLAPATRQFFDGLNIQLKDIYGLSECSGPATLPLIGRTPVGSCGSALPTTQAKIAENGELCLKGRHVFQGYLNRPDATAEAFDEEGFFRTGDKASIDAGGNIRITGRIKDLIITAGGENIPPTNIEDQLKESLGAIADAIVVGDRKPYLTCMVSLKTTELSDGTPSDELLPEVVRELANEGIQATRVSDLRENQKFIDYLERGRIAVNKRATSRAQKIQRITVLPERLSVARGDLTNTLKMKRNVVMQRFATAAESLYTATAPVVFA